MHISQMEYATAFKFETEIQAQQRQEDIRPTQKNLYCDNITRKMVYYVHSVTYEAEVKINEHKFAL